MESTICKNLRDGRVSVIVGVNSYQVDYEQGNLQLNIPGPTVANYLNRGEFGTTPCLRYDQDQPITGSFSAYLRDISDGSFVTLPEFILNAGEYAASWGTTLGSVAEVRTVTLRWDVAGTTHGDLTDHRIDLPFTTLSGSFATGSPTTTGVNFTSWQVYPIVT